MRRIQYLFYLPLLCILVSCSGYRRIEKTDTFSQQRKEIKSIVFLEPDYFKYDENSKDLIEDSKTLAKTKWISKYNSQAASRLGIAYNMLSDSSAEQNKDIAYALQLKQQIKKLCIDFQLDNFNYFSDFTEKKVLSQDLYISPEYSRLENGFQTPYFYYSFVIEHDGIFFINALADLNQGKIIYTEIKEINLPAGKANLWQMMFGSLNTMLTSK